MGLFHLVVAALAATAVLAADAPCACVNPDQTLDPIKNPMLFFQQPTLGGLANGVACAMDCSLTAHAYDEANDGLIIQLLANDLKGAKITVIDGLRTWTISKNTEQKDLNFRSTTGQLIFNFAGDGVTPPGTFMIVVQKSSTGRDPAPIVTSPIVPSPTPPFDVKYKNNPLLVANDIMIVVDLSNGDVPDLKQFATDLISALTITNETDCGVGTRLALHGLTNFDGFSPDYWPDWHYTLDIALGHINSMVQLGDGPYNLANLADTVKSGFKDNSPPTSETDPNTIESRCLNRGRVFVLLSPQQPADWQPEKGNANPGLQKIIDFIGRGVHPILVTSLKEGKRDYYDEYAKVPAGTRPDNRWTYFNIDDGVTKFINNYLVDTTPDLSCQLAKDTKVTLTFDSISLPEKIAIPPYYEGMLPTDNQDNFNLWDKIKHYCNFQSTTVSIEQKGGDDDTKLSDVCIKVYYDLETDRDFVDIYGGDYISGTQKHIVRLTGRDVSGSTFRLGSRVGQIVFSSDEKNVFDGFYATLTPCGATYKP